VVEFKAEHGIAVDVANAAPIAFGARKPSDNSGTLEEPFESEYLRLFINGDDSRREDV
jgi:hypothetical protein